MRWNLKKIRGNMKFKMFLTDLYKSIAYFGCGLSSIPTPDYYKKNTP